MTDNSQKPKIRSGFTVGVLDNEEFVFHIHGENTGVIELEGLLQVAKAVIDKELNQRFKTQDL